MGAVDTIRERLSSLLNPNVPDVPVKSEGAPAMSSRMDIIEMDEPPLKKSTDYINSYRGWVYACVRAIAHEVAKIELVLYRRKGKKIEIVEEHEALETLERVNDFQTRFNFFEGIVGYLELVGEAFIYKYQGKNKELWLLRPDWIKVKPPKKKGEFIGGYTYTVPNTNKAEDFEIEEIVHFKYFNPKNPYRGLGPLQAADYAYDTDFFATRWNRNFFYNNAIPSAILTTDGRLKAKEIKRIKSEWKRKFSGVKKAHLFAILTGGLKFDKGFKQSIKDMEFLNLRKFSRDEIFSIFQVPKTLVSITEDVNKANASEHKSIFIENVIKPKMSRLVAFLNEFYITDWQKDGELLYFGYKDPAPENVTLNLKIVDSGLTKAQVGWLTINEARELMGYDNIGKEGDVLYQTFNVMPGASKKAAKIINKISVKVKKDKGKERDKGVIVRHKITAADILKKKIKEEIIKKPEFRKFVYLLLSKSRPKKKDKKKSKKKKGKDDHNYLPRDKAEALWRQMIARSEAQEINFARELRKFFRKQRDQVLENLKLIKRIKAIKNVDRYLFDLESENNVLIKLIDPVMKRIVSQAGQEALQFVGSSETFNFIEEVIQMIAQTELKFAGSVNKTTYETVRAAIQEGIANDESVDKISTRVNEVYSHATKIRSTQIARTETVRASNLGAEAGYEQSGLVDLKEWLVALDERTCEFCLAMERDFRVRSLGENFLNEGSELRGVDGGIMLVDYSDLQVPPLHTSCRCTIIPVVKTS